MQLHLLSHAEQVAEHLKGEIACGRWKAEMPGVAQLKTDLGINQVTINAALQLLEQEGVLVSQGTKRRRRIAPQRGRLKTPVMRVRILPYDPESRRLQHQNVLLDELHQAGFNAGFARKSLHELGMDPKRVARFVRSSSPSAWIVEAGSREILEWFSQQQDIPSHALFGRFRGLPIAAASPRADRALIAELIQKLVALGHRRLTMLAREERRQPTPAGFEQIFLEELAAHDLKAGRYNLPEWEDTPQGFIACLDELFRHTPPTALIFGEARLMAAAQQHLARKGILAPEQVSMVCSDLSPAMDWYQPPVTHIRWDHRPVVKRVVNWAKNVARGKADRRQVAFEAELVAGGTIGPPPELPIVEN